MIRHVNIDQRALSRSIRQKEIVLAGNSRLKIYGLLGCPSGKRMRAENRVFFIDLEEAVGRGYRPCGHCLYEAYKKWKNGTV